MGAVPKLLQRPQGQRVKGGFRDDGTAACYPPEVDRGQIRCAELSTTEPEPSQNRARAEPSRAELSQVESSRVKTSQRKPEQAGPNQAKPGQAKPSQARASQGKPGQARASQGEPGRARASQGKPRQAKASQGKTRQAKARQDKARQTKPKHTPSSTTSIIDVQRCLPAVHCTLYTLYTLDAHLWGSHGHCTHWLYIFGRLTV